MRTSWDPLHRAYFNGYALWTYLTTPFLLAMDGFEVSEIEPWREGAEVWRGSKSHLPCGDRKPQHRAGFLLRSGHADPPA